MIDWSKEIQIVSDSGRVCYAVLKPGSMKGNRRVFWDTKTTAYSHRFFDNGMPHPGISCWVVRNKAVSTPTPDERAVAPELVARMIDLCRNMAKDEACDYPALARAIVAALEPVDRDLVEVRECVSKEYEKMGRADLSRQVIAGKMDGRLRVQAALAALARGRQLEKEGK